VTRALWDRLFGHPAEESTRRFAFRQAWQLVFVTGAMLAFVSDYTSVPERAVAVVAWLFCVTVLGTQIVARHLHRP
jgi:hypothetical protein